MLSSLLVPLFTMGTWVAPALEVCPMHGGPGSGHGVAQASSDAPSTDHSAHSQHAGAGSNHATGISTGQSGHAIAPRGDTAQDATANGATEHGCDCVGGCFGTNGPALPAVGVAVAPTAVTVHTVEQSWQAGVVPAHNEHVLPFATAPPRTHA